MSALGLEDSRRSALAAIERRRRQLGIAMAALERAAGIAAGHYARLINGRRAPREATLALLRGALAQLAKQRGGVDKASQLYRVLLTLAAKTLGLDPSAVHEQDPSRRATQSPQWMQAAEARRLAVYLMNVVCGLSQADVARAAGMTRQAVSLAARAIEERREDRHFDGLIEKLTEDLRGEW